jgi:hypothetical protein
MTDSWQPNRYYIDLSEDTISLKEKEESNNITHQSLYPPMDQECLHHPLSFSSLPPLLRRMAPECAVILTPIFSIDPKVTLYPIMDIDGDSESEQSHRNIL